MIVSIVIIVLTASLTFFFWANGRERQRAAAIRDRFAPVMIDCVDRLLDAEDLHPEVRSDLQFLLLQANSSKAGYMLLEMYRKPKKFLRQNGGVSSDGVESMTHEQMRDFVLAYRSFQMVVSTYLPILGSTLRDLMITHHKIGQTKPETVDFKHAQIEIARIMRPRIGSEVAA